MSQYPSTTTLPEVGILGGGQLGKMLCQRASAWSVYTHVLDRSKRFPAASVCNRFVEGDFTSFEEVMHFGKNQQIITIEIESVNSKALHALADLGVTVHPNPDALDIIKDKYLQKQFYMENGLPTSRFHAYSGLTDVRTAGLQFPFVMKARRDGYDGRGVQVVRSAADLEQAFDTPCIVEEMVEIEMELAVIVARNANGEIKAFPPVGMTFDPDANLVEFLFCPSGLGPDIEQEAVHIAESTIKAYGLCGLLAVEMFLTRSGEILINEVAPRPHNSGHHTIEACNTSQYEQHLRAILNWPLADIHLKSPAVMVNLLGEPGFSGPVKYQGFEECLKLDETYIHIYGKADTKPWRKMGHVTILGETIEIAMQKAKFVKDTLKVIA